ncbi:alpha-D-ribose 1-methylphosphonate 5-triphosphate diphosphatase [Pseudodesulfovibrio piezophilus]|uniref:Protein phnM n=1 Tax=Pseudodesulfovibrio piezophilus (strain DSM 21447 / JCM 15486 / C1TLV30) TaxID=1322246 RepID=M1WP02_PSEP2|nr:alpha-D-ribose 1-methylphosphonate 5-triphosphate diphosphatase [Pseudodesulfovibrio piezophilus]CCH47914.1 Protein phnM [Pseudodesulfovibrio piezophilus C1TLV30]
MNLIIKNARIVLRDEIVTGALRVCNGIIDAIDTGPCSHKSAVDFNGDYLLPGFVELHTDNLEQQLEPRPGVFWPDPLSAVLAHDAHMFTAGITTVFDAVSLGEYHDGPKRTQILDMSIHALNKARSTGILKSDHKLHLRCEYSDPKVMDFLSPHINDPVLMLVSLMDHTPGQRQFTDTDVYRKYYKQGWSDKEFDEVSQRLITTQRSCAEGNRQMIVELCQQRALPLASHDDTLAVHITQAKMEKVTLSEFPTTLLAASLARKAGIKIVMGGPNVVRGSSHSGNVSARQLAAEGLLDILSSDYVPTSLISGAFTLNREMDIPLHQAIALISLNPAQVTGLHDRGEIALGKRADLVRAREVENIPAVLQTWSTDSPTSFEINQKNAA